MSDHRLRIAIPGGSGQVGHLLAQHFHEQGHTVTVFSRAPQPMPWRVIAWDISTPAVATDEWVDELAQSDVCVNLTGRSVNCRYTAANRREIYDSRIRSTQRLNEVFVALKNPPRLWLNASTATIYRHALDRPMDEATGELGGDEPGAPASWNFSIKVARDWEQAFFSTSTPRTRKIAMRSAITLSPDRGSVFEALLNLVRWGLGGKVGTGQQFVSWIHAVDFLRAVDWLIAREDFTGVVNLASPKPLPNQDFMEAFRTAWGASIGLPVPAPIVEMGCFLMRTESELVLKSRRVVPGRLLDSGFKFLFPEWPAAIQDLAGSWKGAFHR
ncbi:MAG: TIGR01777 family oxidoreductase [Silvibacterium sp.]